MNKYVKNIHIKNIQNVHEAFIDIDTDKIVEVLSSTEARAIYSVLWGLAKSDTNVDFEIERFGGLPDGITRERIHHGLIQRTFEEEFYGQINNLFDSSVGEITVDDSKFIIENNRVKTENLKVIPNEIIYLKEYVPYDKHLENLMTREGSVVDMLISQESFEHIFRKAGVEGWSLRLNQYNQFVVNVPGAREPLHVKNISTSKLIFLIMQHLVYHNADKLMQGFLIVEKPDLTKKKLNLFIELLQLIQSKFGTTVIRVL